MRLFILFMLAVGIVTIIFLSFYLLGKFMSYLMDVEPHIVLLSAGLILTLLLTFVFYDLGILMIGR